MTDTEPKVAVALDDATKAKVKKQILFYFSDANLSRDKFMRNKLSSNEEGWVPLSVFLTFNRLKQLTTDTNAIMDIFKDSPVLDVDTEKVALKRKDKYEAKDDKTMARSLFIDGFSLEASLEDFEKLFADKGDVEYIKLRKAPQGESGETGAASKFNGSVFIQFKTTEEAEKVLNEGVDKLELNGKKPTDIQMMDKWYAEHTKQREALKRKREDDAQKDIELEKGCSLAFKTTKEDLDREYLGGLFGDEKKERVAFIEYTRGEKEGVIRFRSAETVKDAVEVFTKDGNFSEAALLEGEAEEKYLNGVKEALKARAGKGGKSFKKKQRR